ncbi:MAG: hypothetical protein KBA31_05500 [Alphaproteobacteria bacterium]|nr:hypothetical protein [Alphaproteobacteria bacterium]
MWGRISLIAVLWTAASFIATAQAPGEAVTIPLGAPKPAAEPIAPLAMQTPEPKPKPKTEKTLEPGEMMPVNDVPKNAVISARDGKPPSFRCFVRDVMAFYDRTHVRCYNKVNNRINFFAVDTAQPIAATLLQKSLSAMQTGKPIIITFAPATDLNPSNCDRKDCRRLIDVVN